MSTVRRATVVDAPVLAGLRRRWLRERGDAGDAPEAFTESFTESFTEWFAGNAATHRAYLALAGGAPAGMAWLAVLDRVPTPARPRRRSGDVQSVYVVPELRNGGLGTALLTAVLADARGLGLEHVTVHSSERAVPLYLRVGFEPGERWLHWEP